MIYKDLCNYSMLNFDVYEFRKPNSSKLFIIKKIMAYTKKAMLL